MENTTENKENVQNLGQQVTTKDELVKLLEQDFASGVTNMDKMFYECSSLTNINFSLLKTSNVNMIITLSFVCVLPNLL